MGTRIGPAGSHAHLDGGIDMEKASIECGIRKGQGGECWKTKTKACICPLFGY